MVWVGLKSRRMQWLGEMCRFRNVYFTGQMCISGSREDGAQKKCNFFFLYGCATAGNIIGRGIWNCNYKRTFAKIIQHFRIGVDSCHCQQCSVSTSRCHCKPCEKPIHWGPNWHFKFLWFESCWNNCDAAVRLRLGRPENPTWNMRCGSSQADGAGRVLEGPKGAKHTVALLPAPTWSTFSRLNVCPCSKEY